MNEKLKLCNACDDPFHWEDEVVIADYKHYHKDCVELYPTGYVAFLDGNCLGETENDDGQSAYEILDDEELLEVPE